MAHPYLAPTGAVRVFAHRGLVVPTGPAADGVAENTLAAFEAARDAFAAADRTSELRIESDCHLTADGEVVLFHDDTLERVLGEATAVAEISYAALASRMADRGGLLTLSAALEAFPEARFNIDVKAAAAAEAAGRAVAPHGRRVLLTSFSDPIRLRALRAAVTASAGGGSRGLVRPATSPGKGALLRLLLAVRSGARRSAVLALAGIDALQIPERHGPVRVLTPRLVEIAHAHDVEVHVWTVNDPERMVELRALGVDGVITDRADLALEALEG